MKAHNHVCITVERLRASLAEVVKCVRKGTRFTVTYRGEPVFRIVSVTDRDRRAIALEDDPRYRAPAVGRSSDRWTAADHDSILRSR